MLLKNKWLIAIGMVLLVILLSGCTYAPDHVDDWPIRCNHCSSGWTVKTTTIHCRADSVLATACQTKCRHCDRFLAQPTDEVQMTALSGGVYVIEK